MHDKKLIDFSSQVLVFIHIPKTGGVSVSSTLIEAFGPDHCIGLPQDMFEQIIGSPLHEATIAARKRISAVRQKFTGPKFKNIDQMSSEDRDNIHLIHGHIRLGSEPDTGREPLYVSLVRDPVDRIASQYWYLRSSMGWRIPQDPSKRLVLGRSLDGYIEALHKLGARHSWNQQCQYLAREQSFEAAREACESRFFCAMTFDQIAEFTNYICQAANRELVPVKHANQSSKRPRDTGISETAMAMMEDMYGEDMKIYRWLNSRDQ